MKTSNLGIFGVVAVALVGCQPETDPVAPSLDAEEAARHGGSKRALVAELRAHLAAHDVTPIPAPPTPSIELFALGQALAFDPILSGNRDISCLTCHRPDLGTVDARPLPLGEGGTGLGMQRRGGNDVPRNAPELFNRHVLPGMFWDSRVAEDGQGGFDTPAGSQLTPEMEAVLEYGAVAAQAMFPPTSPVEMRGQPGENPIANLPMGDFTGIWAAYMDRLGDIPQYRTMFEAAYPGTDFDDMSFAHVGNAIGAFESEAFYTTDSPFQRFVAGDDDALSRRELKGGIAFFADGCGSCHNGPTLSDGQFHNVGLPQFGPGHADGPDGDDDFGRFAETGDPTDLYRFRTPSLMNVELTAPYGHAGQYADLEGIVDHYRDPTDRLLNFDVEANVIDPRLHDTVLDNKTEILANLSPILTNGLSARSTGRNMVAFLESMTDDRARDLSDLIPTSVPSGLMLDTPTPQHATFTNVAEDDDKGITWERGRSAEYAAIEALRAQSYQAPLGFQDFLLAPHRATGLPGVAILDADGDGDLDIYATNGPGAANALLVNQLNESGKMTFVDEGAVRGADVLAQDSQGVCYGDLDNDGDDDLYVLGRNGPNVLLENDGSGHFVEVTATGAEGGTLNHTSCSMGDIDNDGLLDIVVSNTFDFNNLLPILAEPYFLNQPNQLFHNDGALTFTDDSTTSGIRELNGLDGAFPGAATISWAVSMVDVDRDGDMDVVFADDQAGIPRESIGGVDRGFMQVMVNDGTGFFTSQPVTTPGVPQYAAPWMGLSWGDFDCDGNLDMFASNFGDYDSVTLGVPLPYFFHDEASRPLYGVGDGSFTDPGPGDEATVFGWGNAVFDADNDGDHDVVYQGGMNLGFMAIVDNPGIYLENNGCGAGFTTHRNVFTKSDHTRRIDQGLAVGDLDDDGFIDIVSAASEVLNPMSPLIPSEAPWGSAIDETAYFSPQFAPVGPDAFVYIGLDESPGRLTVEMNDGGTAASVSFDLVGSVGLTPGAGTNRSAIGAVVDFQPSGGDAVSKPVVGGSSFASQHALRQHFGLGDAYRGTVEVTWPSGYLNAYGQTWAGERRVLPEIPCSIDDPAFTHMGQLLQCVQPALRDLRQEGVLDGFEAARIRRAMRTAWRDHNGW
jgi:cytochrome c peroxidase